MAASSHIGVPRSTRAEVYLVAHVPGRVIEVLSRVKAAARNRRAVRSLGPIVSQILPSTQGYELLVANADAAVFRVEYDHGLKTILKFGTNPEACEQLSHEIAALHELHEFEQLGDWRASIATLESQGTHEAGIWFRQSVVPGKPTSSIDLNMGELVAQVSHAIRPLHVATEKRQVIDGPLLASIVDGPLAMVERWRPNLATGLSNIGEYLEERLAGRPLVLSRQHGDLAPSNVLWDSESGAVSGIVDWKLADQMLPPEVDLTHYAISLISLRRRIEYGEAVTWLLGEGRDSEEAEVARSACEAGPNGLGLHCSVTLAWLQHVSFGLAKAVDLQTNPIWLTNNIDQVVQGFNR